MILWISAVIKMPIKLCQFYLAVGAIPIINENDSVVIDELKVGDNDTLSAQVAAMVQADLLVLLTDVDGLYTGNPHSDPTAKRLEKIETINREIIDMAGGAGSSNGTGGHADKNQSCHNCDRVRSSCLYLLILEDGCHD